MTPGETIMIYVDPEMTIEEGRAELIELIHDYGEEQKWLVRFEDYPYTPFVRMIKT